MGAAPGSAKIGSKRPGQQGGRHNRDQARVSRVEGPYRDQAHVSSIHWVEEGEKEEEEEEEEEESTGNEAVFGCSTRSLSGMHL